MLTDETIGDMLLIVDRLGVGRAGLSTKGISRDKITLRDLCVASGADALFASSPCGPSFI